MKKWLNLLPVGAALVLALPPVLPAVNAASGTVRLQVSGTNTLLQVQGKADDEWRFQISSNLLTWTNAPALGTVFAGDADAPPKSAGSPVGSPRFFRAVRTEGLFDAEVLRTISLTFTQSNWPTLLARGRTTGSNTVGNLVLDNGVTNLGIGARYRGNTSYETGGTKKSVNLEINFTNAATRLMGYKTVNLNNAAGDETILREALYFNVMRQYTVCPRASLVRLNINGDRWGVYSFVEQENSELIDDWFPSHDGDRWRAPNMPGGGAVRGLATEAAFGGGGIGGGGFSSGSSALSYLGANLASYKANYELKTDNSTNAWERLVHVIDVLNNTPTNQLRDKVEDVLAVDRWLWFLAIENIFADDDSYFNKGADYGFYFEPETGRIHPVEHDGNESFIPGDVQLSPVQGANTSTRPVLYRLLSIPELRQRYLAHMRTVLQEYYHPTVLLSFIDRYQALSVAAIMLDPKKNFSMTAYTNDLNTLKAFVRQRYAFLTNHAELRPLAPRIVAVNPPAVEPTPSQTPIITAQVQASGANGIASVWLYYRDKTYGRFARSQMFDDGAHGDGAANDGVFGGGTTNFPAGHKIHFYVEARSATSPNAACFAPVRAEEDTFSYRVGLAPAVSTPVVINELMAANATTLVDPQGDFDDWIELRNVTDAAVDLTGLYLSDDPNDPRQWRFPDDTKIPAQGYLLIWADGNSGDSPGLHANFKLSAGGEQVLLVDTDENLNALLDTVTFGQQETDRSYGRTARDPAVFEVMWPTPEAPNQ